MDKIYKMSPVAAVFASMAITALSYVAIFAFMGMKGLEYQINWIEAAAVFTSFICTLWLVNEHRIGYLMSLVTVILYSILFFQANLIGSAMANGLFLVWASFYGWAYWGNEGSGPPVSFLKLENRTNAFAILSLTSLAAFVGMVILITELDGKMPVADTFILFGTIVAQLLMIRKFVETWPVWLAMNFVALYVYGSAEMYAVAIQYMFFIVNAFYGYWHWNKSMREGVTT